MSLISIPTYKPMLVPSEIKAANLQLATDAYDLSALIAGASVPTWANNGAHSDDLIASGGGQPTFQPTGLNGRPYVQFDGTDDFFTCDALATLFSGSDMPFTFAAVMNATGATTQIVASLGNSA